jgi:hypothetical protein
VAGRPLGARRAPVWARPRPRPAREPWRQGPPRPAGDHPQPGHSRPPRGPAAGPCRGRQAAPATGRRHAHVSSRGAARRGGARRLTGRAGEAPRAGARGCPTSSGAHAAEPSGRGPGARRGDGTSASARSSAATVADGTRGLPLPRTCDSRAHACGAATAWPRTGWGDSDVSRPHSAITRVGPSPLGGRERRNTGVVPPHAHGPCLGKCRQDTAPAADGASPETAGTNGNNPPLGAVYLLTTGGLIRVSPACSTTGRNSSRTA